MVLMLSNFNLNITLLVQAEPESGASLPHQYSLMAGQGVPGKGD